ncbi:MAG TPA: hypothetical protein VFW59_02800, partial [Gallionella sp.]|nr:hypothetical protein [Gallionella sp.]
RNVAAYLSNGPVPAAFLVLAVLSVLSSLLPNQPPTVFLASLTVELTEEQPARADNNTHNAIRRDNEFISLPSGI